MDIRLFCYRCFVFLGLWGGYEAQNGNQTTHQRTDDVEEAEGKIDQSRDAKNCTLRHTAIYLGMGIAGGHDSLKEAFGRNTVFACYPHKYFRLENEGTDACREGRKQKGDEGWRLSVDEPSGKSRNEHGKQRDIESMAQTGKILADIHWFGIIAETDDKIEYQ